MLKINASYSKKVPAEAEYSSQSYHCSIEAELPDGLSHEQLQERIHATFATVREAVEAELHGQATQAPPQAPPHTPPFQQFASPAAPPQAMNQAAPRQPQPRSQGLAAGRPNAPASSRQINYLLNLAKRSGWNAQDIASHCQVSRLEDIDKRTCSQLIEHFSGRAA
jgi:hypothetical protein